MITPDLFAAHEPAKPAPLTSRPDSNHYAYVWQPGPPTYRPYDSQLLDDIRALLVNGSMQFGELADAFRPRHESMVVGVHVDKLRATGEIIETQDFLGAPDARDPGYSGWMPRYALASTLN